MQCPDCKQYRHDGPCDPYHSDMACYERDTADDLEMLQIDAERAAERYAAALEKQQGGTDGKSV